MKIIDGSKITRRYFLQGLGMLSAGMALMPRTAFAQNPKPITRAIPSTGERLPVIGMGTSRTFDVGNDPAALTQLQEVLQTFFDNGGALIDSSPMYGNAEAVVGDLLKNIRNKDTLFAATKVWTDGRHRPDAEIHATDRGSGDGFNADPQFKGLENSPAHPQAVEKGRQNPLHRHYDFQRSLPR